jgi:hypothetical protein
MAYSDSGKNKDDSRTSKDTLMSVTMPQSTNFEIPIAKSAFTLGAVSSLNLAMRRSVIT